jgi:RNA polymerase sigma-70 factor (ECF subfamily)
MAGQIERFSKSERPAPALRVIPRTGEAVRDRCDEALMLDHAAGDEAAFEELVRRHQRGLLNYIYRLVNNRQTADELTQEVFLALVKNAQRYQPTAKFTTYLYRIASNMVSKEWLRRKRRPMLLSLSSRFGRHNNEEEEYCPLDHVGDARANLTETVQRQEISEAVNKALSALPEHQREAFVLRRFSDVPYEEIAQIVNAPVGTVKSRVVRAERALRPLLEQYREYI